MKKGVVQKLSTYDRLGMLVSKAEGVKSEVN